MAWSAEQLRSLLSSRLGGRKLIVVSNREPYVHSYAGDQVVCQVPAGGMVSALDPVMRACAGTWVAHGSGEADRATVDERDCLAVPPVGGRFHPSGLYQLRRVWLSKEEEDGYYYGFANRALWPMCHRVFVRPRFDPAEWEQYRAVNAKFASAVLEEAEGGPAVVFVQDYHFALLPRLLKRARPDLVVAQFWHIPWPGRDVFGICPWVEEILDGMLGNDLLGFHTQQDCNNFLNTVDRTVEAVVNYDQFTVRRQKRRTQVRPFPIGVDTAALTAEALRPSVEVEADRLRHGLGLHDKVVAIGVDRLDYTKGLPERLRAIDRFLERYPEHVGRFSYLQLGPVSRIHIPEYRQLNDELYELMNLINRKHGVGSWQPIRILKANHPHDILMAYFRLADLCVVSSLHDGMNLVAKEFVAARPDGDAALVLSRFTGAAQELTEAVRVNPYDVDAFATAIKQAIDLPREEKRRRMAAMRQRLTENSVYDWAARILTDLSRIAPAQPVPAVRRPVPISA